MSTFPALSTNVPGHVAAGFQSAAQAAGLDVGHLGEITALQAAVGNLLTTLPLRPLWPSYTTTQRNLLTVPEGTVIYNTTAGVPQFWNGSAWGSL